MNYKLVIGGLLAITSIGLWIAYDHSPYDSEHPNMLRRAKEDFYNFKRKYGKSYTTIDEAIYRLKIFAANSKKIKEHNDKNASFTLAINQFADLTFLEFKEKYLTIMDPIPESKCDKQDANHSLVNKSDKIDWSALNKVQKVKDQKNCGSCWAFAAVGALESAYAIFKDSDVPNLSEQELVDCSKPYGNQGCNGGLMNLAYDYVLDNNLNNERDYEYKGRTQTCKQDKKGHGEFSITKCVKVEPNIDGLVNSLAQQPVAVALSAGFSFMFYDSGILDPYFCDDEVNHGVLAVGYDLTAPKPFFIVKNSWGTSWGEKGYFRIAIGKIPSGVCNIAGSGDNYYPVI